MIHHRRQLRHGFTIMNFNVTNGGLEIKIYLSKVDEDSNVIGLESVGFHPSIGFRFLLPRSWMTPEARSAVPSRESIFRQPLWSIFVITTDTNGHVLATRTYGGNLPIGGEPHPRYRSRKQDHSGPPESGGRRILGLLGAVSRTPS